MIEVAVEVAEMGIVIVTAADLLVVHVHRLDD